MSRFTTRLQIEEVDGANTWRLLMPVVFHVGSEDSKEIIHVPTDYETDFASVPRFFWRVIPPYDYRYGKAAVVHDFICTFRGVHESFAHPYSSADAARIFLQGMEVLNAPRLKRRLMYYAVRVFGPQWRNDQ